jgi:hypothetical protein
MRGPLGGSNMIPVMAATEVEYGRATPLSFAPAAVAAQAANVQASAELDGAKKLVSHQARVAVTRSLKRLASATRERLLNIT